MATGILIKETMSGWMRLNDENQARDFAFSIRAFTTHIFKLTAPRFFRGTVTLDGEQYPCRGELVLYTHGPSYWVELQHPQLGMLRVEGKKTYGKNGLLHSLVTCPMVVKRDGREIGLAEVAYRDSMLAFPFKAIRFVAEEKAYDMAEASS